MQRRIVNLMLVVCLAATALFAGQYNYPEAKVIDVVDTLHGVPVHDPYRWLENTDDPAVQKWTDEENALTRSLLDALPQREEVKARLADLWSYTQTSTPSRYGDRYFFSRKEGLQDHAVIFYQDGLEAEPVVVLDPNKFEDKTAAVNFTYPSPQGKYFAYGVSTSGTEVATISVRDVATMQDLPFQIPRARYSSIVWDQDAGGFFYTRLPDVGSVPEGDENYFRRIYYHKLGTEIAGDPLIWRDDENKEYSPGLSRSEDFNYLFMMIWYSTNEENSLYYMDLNDRDAGFMPMVDNFESTNIPAMIDTIAYIMTTDGAPNRKIMFTNIKTPEKANWSELIPESEDLLESFSIINRNLVLQYLHNAHHVLKIHTLGGRYLKTIELPTLGTVSELTGNWDQPEMFFKFQSFNYPRTNFRYDFDTEQLEQIEQIEIDVNPDDYESKQVWYTSKDGTQIPMFVVHKKGIALDGSNPALLYGYGGFFSSQTPWFSGSYSYLLEKGIVLGVPNIRGGGEFGEEWHRAGMLENKQNVYDDFIAAAEWLIDNKYTNPDKLAIRGGSNGGLLVGAVMVQRPDLFKVVMCGVPLLDMIRYHQFLIARFWIPEYGSSEDPAQFEYLLKYSPYHNIKQGTSYPATILTAGESDGRVHPLHARKMAAALQAANTGDNPILILVQRRAGHGQGKPTSMALEESTDEWTFLFWQLGLFDE